MQKNMQYKLTSIIAAGLGAFFISTSVSATVIGDPADIFVGLGGDRSDEGYCKTADLSDVVIGGGLEVSLGDYTGRCGGAVEVDIDGALNLITITARRESDVGDYGFLDIHIDGLDWVDMPGSITDVTLISDNLFDPEFVIPNLAIEWSDNSIWLTWLACDDDFCFDLLDGGIAQLSFSASHDIPEPAALGLLAAGLIGIGTMRRRRKSA